MKRIIYIIKNAKHFNLLPSKKSVITARSEWAALIWESKVA